MSSRKLSVRRIGVRLAVLRWCTDIGILVQK